jgi:hypothetical protein
MRIVRAGRPVLQFLIPDAKRHWEQITPIFDLVAGKIEQLPPPNKQNAHLEPRRALLKMIKPFSCNSYDLIYVIV